MIALRAAIGAMIRAAAIGAASIALAACGYHPAHAPVDPAGPFHLVAGRARVPDTAAMTAVEEGARAELSRAGQLAGGGEGSPIEIDVLRVDDGAIGVALPSGIPLARGARVTVTGRARIRRGAAVERDTGDVVATEIEARAADPGRALVTREEAVRSAARALGERLVRRLLGLPEPASPL